MVKLKVEESQKKKILIIGDAVVPTGFARVLHSLFTPLTKKYSIHHLGVNYRGDPHNFNYPIYPAILGGDIYGFGRLENLIEVIKPDVIFILNDLWIHSDYVERLNKYLGKIKIILYTPIDGGPIEPSWLKSIKDVDRLLVYTNFGKSVINQGLKVWGENETIKFPKVEILPHGIDTTKFYPFQDKDIAKRTLYPNREDFFNNSFIVLNANRNQPRKRLDITLKAFALFSKDKPSNVKLYLHTGVEDMGWNILSLAKRYGIDSRVIITSLAHNLQTVPDEKLNLIYNACDVGLNTSVGEGWGLCSWEHAATKAAQIVPKHSSNIELWEKRRGILIEPSFQLTTERVLTEGFIVAPESVAKGLQVLYENKDLRNELAENAYNYITKKRFSWKAISKKLDNIIMDVLEEKSKEEAEDYGNIVAI
jgi:glycosyltransferase involved in cell wall biosynthesis